MDESKYQKLVREKYAAEADMRRNSSCTMDLVYYGPIQYGNEEEMLKYVEEHPDIALQDLFDYWDSITPEGLPPGMTEADLMDDEE